MNNEVKIYKNMVTGETEIKDICVYVERDSISMGDDVTAPHRKKIFLKKDDKLSDLLKELMNNYIVQIKNCVWEINVENNVLGYVTYDSNFKKTYELVIPDDLIVNLQIKSIYCKKIGEINKNEKRKF